MSGVLFLVRGLPGSGKTSFATHIWNDYAVCEADKFFYDKEGNYNFDGSKLKEAHEWCRNNTEEWMKQDWNVAVSNTFTQEWEMKTFLVLARRFRYKVYTVIVENRHGGKNLHGVPEDKLQIMKDRFEVKL